MKDDILKQKAVGHARWLARQYGARGVVVLVFDGERVAGERSNQMNERELVEKLAEDLNGTITEEGRLPDGSGFALMSMPLPKNHWLFAEGRNVPPMTLRCGVDSPLHGQLRDALVRAGEYAVRCATMNGKEMDFDPDALIQSLLVGALGYCTPDGLSSNDWANPSPEPASVVSIEKR